MNKIGFLLLTMVFVPTFSWADDTSTEPNFCLTSAPAIDGSIQKYISDSCIATISKRNAIVKTLDSSSSEQASNWGAAGGLGTAASAAPSANTGSAANSIYK